MIAIPVVQGLFSLHRAQQIQRSQLEINWPSFQTAFMQGHLQRPAHTSHGSSWVTVLWRLPHFSVVWQIAACVSVEVGIQVSSSFVHVHVPLLQLWEKHTAGKIPAPFVAAYSYQNVGWRPFSIGFLFMVRKIVAQQQAQLGTCCNSSQVNKFAKCFTFWNNILNYVLECIQHIQFKTL